MTDHQEVDAELERVYAEALEDEVFFAEYSGMPVAAGDVRDLKSLAESADPPQTPNELLQTLMETFMGAIVDLCVLGEKRETRADGCRSAWEAFKRAREAGEFPRTVAAREALGLPCGETKELGTF